jgi:cyclic pyranopterin phosphate synthase
MPEAEYVWLPRQDILQFEEMSTLVDVFAAAGVDRIRLHGRRSPARRDLPELVEMLAQKPAIRDSALTTNGVMLAGQSDALHRAGLHRLTVSLDTLRADRVQGAHALRSLPQVLAGIDEAGKTFRTLKLDSVIYSRHE